MKRVLLDSCVWGGTLAELVAAGHEVEWVGSWPSDPGDEEILDRAHAERRVLVTLDRDFGELAIVHGRKHSGIVRLVGLSARQQGRAVVAALASYGGELAQGAVVTVEPGRVRIRAAHGSPDE